MRTSIDPTIDGGVLKQKNANCESRVKPVHYIFYTHIIDIPGIQDPTRISLADRGSEYRQ